ncbi:MAG: flagellar biosynthetic protein FliR [Syntrophomonadaceae bacterium]|jgi:flagellar biosynthetic protein FliR
MLGFSVEGFLLVLARISGLFLSAPIFSSRQMPGQIKIVAVLVLAAMMAYFLPVTTGLELASPLYMLAAVVLEVLVGYTIGFIAYMLFAGIQLAGQLMDMQMGFAIVNVVDPQSGMQIPLMGNLTQTVALLSYLAVNGHHYLLQAVAQSYQIIPVLGLKLGSDFSQRLFAISAEMFVIALKVAAPLVIAILITDVAMGFIARTVPQMNVFIVGLPLKIMMGLGCLLFMFPVYLWVFDMLFTRFFGYLDGIMAFMR